MTRFRLFVGVMFAVLVTCGTITFGEYFTVPTYEVDADIPAGAATLGPTSPSYGINEHCSGLSFNADAEQVIIIFEIPDCWDGASDITLKIYWCNEAGDALADGETVVYDAIWRSIVWGTEGADSGIAATGTVTYTQSGAGSAAQTEESEITIPRTGGNQPLAVGDNLIIIFNRDNTADTYSGDPIVDKFEISLQSTTPICDHL